MGYDLDIANRLRELLAREPGVVEKAMFGGLAFLIDGHMTVAASGRGGLLLRADPARAADLAEDPSASPAVMGGRTMDGWLRVDIDARASEAELAAWVEPAVVYVRSLPAK